MEWQSEQINELVAAITRAQLKMTPAIKDHVNPYFKSKYADLPSCWEALAPFRDEGIAIVQSPMDGPDGWVMLDTQLSHTSGQWMRSRLRIRVAKDDPQGYGSAITYARRYALGCMTGLVTEEDDDGNAASNKPGQPSPGNVAAMKQKMASAVGVPPGPDAAVKAGGGGPPADQSDVMVRAGTARRTLATLDLTARAVNEWYRGLDAEVRKEVHDDYTHALKQASGVKA